MEELTIRCDEVPEDTVVFRLGGKFDPTICGLEMLRGVSIVITRENATKIRDWFTQWLEETK